MLSKDRWRELFLRAQIERARPKVKDSRFQWSLFIHHSGRARWVSNNRSLGQVHLSRKRGLIIKDRVCLRFQEQKCSWVSRRNKSWKTIRNQESSVTCPCLTLCVCLFLFPGRIDFSASCSMWQTWWLPTAPRIPCYFQLHEERDRLIQLPLVSSAYLLEWHLCSSRTSEPSAVQSMDIRIKPQQCSRN